jgi:hypothetical protein
MPKATLTFTLPEENEEYKITSKSMDYYCALVGVAEAIRSKKKYSDEESTTWNDVSDLFWNIMNESGVEI